MRPISVLAQLGGGIRDMATIEIVAGQGACPGDPGHDRRARPRTGQAQAAKAFPGKVAVGIDARGGMVAVQGWAETTDITALDLAQKFEDAGVAAIIYTDIDRDGAMGKARTSRCHRCACQCGVHPRDCLGRRVVHG